MGSRTIAFIGSPTDSGAGHLVASMGPEVLRVAGCEAALVQRGCSVLDTGNICGPLNPWQPPSNGYRHLPEVVAWNRALMDAVHAQLAADRLPVVLGDRKSTRLNSSH